jgi:hypothetical protein
MKKLPLLALLFLLPAMVSHSETRFINVADNRAIRANNGVVDIQVRSDESYVISISDENARFVFVQTDEDITTHRFENVARGTHTIKMITASGEVIEITVHILRVAAG